MEYDKRGRRIEEENKSARELFVMFAGAALAGALIWGLIIFVVMWWLYG